MSFTATDVRDRAYCPRLPYFRYVLPIPTPPTWKMREGRLVHEEARAQGRPDPASYGLAGPWTVETEVTLSSAALGLSGRPDIVFIGEREAVVVDYKNGCGPARATHALQLAALALLVEEEWLVPVDKGLIHFLQDEAWDIIPITSALRDEVRHSLGALAAMVDHETMPPPALHDAFCRDCTLRRFCNDRPTPDTDDARASRRDSLARAQGVAQRLRREGISRRIAPASRANRDQVP